MANFGGKRGLLPLLGLGILEQAVSSVTNFIFVALLARTLDASSFGQFGVAWAAVFLIESLCWGYLGEPVPPVAAALPKGRWAKMRAAVWILSGLLSIAICVLTGLAAAVALAISEQLVPLVFASGGAAVGLRLQQALRRICYLDEDRVLSLASTLVASVVLFASYLSLSNTGASVELALTCWALSTTSGAAMMTIRAHRFAKPGFRFVRWLALKLSRGGKWLVPSSLLYWLSNYSLLPLAAQLSGLEFAGVLRVIQTLFSPLQQGTAAIMSVMSPRVAHQLASAPDRRDELTRRLVGWAACLSAVYSAVILIAGPFAGSLIFPKQSEHISLTLLAIFAATATFDAVRSGLNVVLIASGGDRVIWSARLWGTAVFLVALVAFLALEDLNVPLSVLAGAGAGSLLSLLLARSRRWGL